MLKTGKFHQFKINKSSKQENKNENILMSLNNTLQLPLNQSNRNLATNASTIRIDAESMNSAFFTNDEDFHSISTTCNNANDDMHDVSIKKKQIIKNKKKSKRKYFFS